MLNKRGLPFIILALLLLTHQFEISAALAGRITQSGLAKLAVHPDVFGIGMDGTGRFCSWNQTQVYQR